MKDRLQSIIDAYQLNLDKIPKHIAVIMDGNGRWAEQNGSLRNIGHKKGYDNLTNIIEYCNDLGVSYLSAYAFSTENWKRPEKEVSFLMKLLKNVLKNEIKKFNKNNVKLRFYGNISVLPKDIRDLIKESETSTQNLSGLQVNIMLNYGSKFELVKAFQSISSSQYTPDEITEDLISRHLYTHDLPDPDILIRPGGEVRLSNFMLWQCAYSELFFTDTLWPDFSLEELISIIKDFQTRHRRFGGLK